MCPYYPHTVRPLGSPEREKADEAWAKAVETVDKALDITTEFRLKPTFIDAIRWDGTQDRLEAIREFFFGVSVVADLADPLCSLTVVDAEGTLVVEHGEWLECGRTGKLQTRDPDVFRRMYEPVFSV